MSLQFLSQSVPQLNYNYGPHSVPRILDETLFSDISCISDRIIYRSPPRTHMASFVPGCQSLLQQINQMHSPKRQQPSHYHTPQSPSQTLPLQSLRQNKSQTDHPYKYEMESSTSTFDSSQRTKFCNGIPKDLKLSKKDTYDTHKGAQYQSERNSYQELKASSSNNTLSNNFRNSYNVYETKTPRQKPTCEVPSNEYLRNSRDWGFNKIPRKDSWKPKVTDDLCKVGYGQHVKVEALSGHRKSKDFSYSGVICDDSLEYQNQYSVNVESKRSSFNPSRNYEPVKRRESQHYRKLKETTISDFAIGKSKGKGMFGNVYMARLKANGALFAIKKISKEIVIKNKMQAQLGLQIKLQMFLDHPNILKLYHFFDDKDHIYLVMEYMEEGSLFDFMQGKPQRFTEKEAALVVIEMSNALTYLHDLDIVHRDIKPQNIVISNGIHKLCDFGWATICNDRRSTYCGTFDYAAPEILEGKEYDGGVDLWCLGVLTYELLIGKVPFYNCSRKESIRKIINSDKQGPQFPASISAKCRHFIESLMRKQPQQRLGAEDLHSQPFLSIYLPKERFFY